MKIIAFPKEANPYQRLLYSKFPSKYHVTYLTDISKNHNISLLCLPFQLLFFRFSGYKIFHLHFVYPFRLIHFPFSDALPFRVVMSLYFILFVYYLRILGYKLVWTAHDLIPHGTYFINDISMMKFLSNLSDSIIIHSHSSLNRMKELGMNNTKCSIIPIGNYNGLYNLNNRSIDKKQKSKLVFGFFGKIREDKGVNDLITTYSEANFLNSKLLVVGQCEDGTKNRLVELSKQNSNISLMLSYVPNNEISSYFDIFDVVVLPFKNITTTSSVLLAMSFKKTVICPLLGDLVDFPKDTGIFYDPKNKNGLFEAMKFAVENRELLKKIGLNGYKYTETLNWSKSATMTVTLFESLL